MTRQERITKILARIRQIAPDTLQLLRLLIPSGVRRQGNQRSVSGAGQVCKRRSRWQGKLTSARIRKSPAGNASAGTLSPSLDPAVPLHSATPPVSLRGARLSLSIFSIYAFRNSHLRTFIKPHTCHLSRHRDIHRTIGYRTLEVLGKTG